MVAYEAKLLHWIGEQHPELTDVHRRKILIKQLHMVCVGNLALFQSTFDFFELDYETQRIMTFHVFNCIEMCLRDHVNKFLQQMRRMNNC